MKSEKDLADFELVELLFVSTTTSIYSITVQKHSVLLSSEQNVQECDATEAQ